MSAKKINHIIGAPEFADESHSRFLAHTGVNGYFID